MSATLEFQVGVVPLQGTRLLGGTGSSLHPAKTSDETIADNKTNPLNLIFSNLKAMLCQSRQKINVVTCTFGINFV